VSGAGTPTVASKKLEELNENKLNVQPNHCNKITLFELKNN